VTFKGIKSVQIYSDLGAYNFCEPHEKQWQLSFRVVHADGVTSISEFFPEDDEPDWMYPIEALELIAARLERYWLSTKRDKNRKTIALLRENLPEIERVYAEAKVKALRADLEFWLDHIKEAKENATS